MTANAETTDVSKTQLPVIAELPDTSAVISSNCKNCDTELVGRYCHECGQHDHLYLRNIFAVVGDLFGEIGHWDSRFYRTIIALMLRPAFLSLEFVRGRRASYVPPLRLYFFISLIAFVVIGSIIDDTDFKLADDTPASSTSTPVSQTSDNTVILDPIHASDSTTDQAIKEATKGTGIDFRDLETNTPFLSEEDEEFLKAKAQYLSDNPRVLRQRLISVAPQMMLIMLPFWAMYLKLLYLFRKRYYLEHLTVALHTHAFLLLSISLIAIAEGVSAWLTAKTGFTFIRQTYGWFENIMFFWMPAYLLFTQKLFYQQSWPMTLVKFGFSAFGYALLLFSVFVMTLIISVLTA